MNGYLCTCDEGYTGKLCDKGIKICKSVLYLIFFAFCFTNNSFLFCFPKAVQVFVPPDIVTAPRDLKIDLYDEGRLECTSSGVPTPVTNWYKDGHRIVNDNVDQSVLMFSSIDLDNRGIYYCEVTSTNNGEVFSKKSDEIIVNIKSKELI